MGLWISLAAPTSMTVRRGGATYNHFLELVYACGVVAPLGLTVAACWAARLARKGQRLVARLPARPPPVLSESPGATLLAGHRVVLEPRSMPELRAAGVWDDAPLVAAIQQQS